MVSQANRSKVLDSLMKEAVVKKVAFPQAMTELNTRDKKWISAQYEIGQKSDQKEIPIASVTKKSYSTELVLYTRFTMSEKDQDKAENDLNKARKEIQKDPKYKELEGSAAGKKMYDEFLIKTQKEIDKKYSPKEHPVAWGIGSHFSVNPDMFKYYYGRGRGYSGAPTSRKQLIEYIKKYGGKAYHITKDPDVRKNRMDRSKNRPEDETEKSITNRAKMFSEEKKKQLGPMLDRYIGEQRAIMKSNLDSLADKIKSGDIFSESDVNKAVYKNIDVKAIAAIGYVFWKLNSGGGSYTNNTDALMNFVKDVNLVINKIK